MNRLRRNTGLTRRRLLSGTAALSALPLLAGWPLLAGCGARRAPEGPPNVLIVFADAHRAAALGCSGNRELATPHFDRLAAQGLHLTRAVSSTPLCRPYRASLMTGAFGHHSGMLTNYDDVNATEDDGRQWLPGERMTLGRLFQEAGYRCGYVGKWHLGDTNTDPGPLRFGFDDYWRVACGPQKDYFNFSYLSGRDRLTEVRDRFAGTVMTDLALEFIESAPPRPAPPWLLVLSWRPPHEPFITMPGSRRPTRAPVSPSVPAEQAAKCGVSLSRYYGMIEALDLEFGRLMEGLRRSGQAEDTLVVYTADHGTTIGEHGFMGKEVPYATSTLVPLLMRWPRALPAGVTLDAPFGTPDILPTLAGLAGLTPPAGLDGRDLSSLLRGGSGEVAAPEAAYLCGYRPEHPDVQPWRGVMTREHLYARTREAPWLLYDLVRDPHELVNLVETRPELQQQLDAWLTRTMAATGDDWSLG